jgi:hypothetical protein
MSKPKPDLAKQSKKYYLFGVKYTIWKAGKKKYYL